MDRHEAVAEIIRGKLGLLEMYQAHLVKLLREQYPEQRGTCGECRWWDGDRPWGTQDLRYCTHRETASFLATASDCSCPRFVRREDKAARLAREVCKFLSGNLPEYNDEAVGGVAKILRANGVGEE